MYPRKILKNKCLGLNVEAILANNTDHSKEFDNSQVSLTL